MSTLGAELGSRTRIWWRCARGHEWDARVTQEGGP
ncbi:MAG: hypothetical protein CVU63_13600 [Deltaproteobacteria bacterium HGW-Deltaproteobacteria-20]|nr:MAG: hypothetical protein CVU63_13600 [Deltaproteobacteria bacterium HGW-Deltaproteobacteria-20]